MSSHRDVTGRPRALILGCAAEELSEAERRFFEAAQPLGFILFARNCRNAAQVSDLCQNLRQSVGRADAPVLIDQEGGRVARLRPPEWRAYPAAGVLGALAARDEEKGEAAAWIVGRLIGNDLAKLGISVDCAPVVDVLSSDAHADAIGDRSYGRDPRRVARLAERFAAGLLAAGILPIIKHIPGHGRARVDSHEALPVVDAPRAELETSDFEPFRALRGLPLAMTAHVVFRAIDGRRPATLSPAVIDVIRTSIGFDGLLLSDDLSMGALSGALGDRAASALEAGCDIALHCNGDMREMEEVVEVVGPMNDDGWARWSAARRCVDREGGGAIDAVSLAAELHELLGRTA